MAEVKLTRESLSNIPTELTKLRQWLLWRWERKPNGDKTKVPITPLGRLASSTNPATWCHYADAVEAYFLGQGNGIGFVFTKDDDYIGIDFDDCADFAGKNVQQPEETYWRLLDSYSEYSPSGTGFKVIIKGKLPEGSRHGFGKGNGIYESGRFFTITGSPVGEVKPIREVPAHELQSLLDVWFPEQQARVSWEPRPERFTDNEVRRMAWAASNRDKFFALEAGEWQEYYPSKSEADAGLCALYAFYTGPNPAQIDRLFRTSDLMSEKWDEARGEMTYGERTINYVLDNAKEFYGGQGEPAEDGAAVAAANTDAAPAPSGSVAPVKEPKWRRAMEGYSALTENEMPWALRKLHDHIKPLASGFVEDWAALSALGFISSLFPAVRFENLPLIVWTLGISEQATGKSLVADELNEITHGVSDRLGVPLAKYGSGSTAGLIRRLQGEKRAMLAYFSEWSSLMGEMERDFGSTMKDTLLNLYDGRSQVHQLATETIEVNNPRLVVSGVTTVENWIRTGNMASIADGFYSRLLFMAPNTWTNYVPEYREQVHDARRRLIYELGEHWGTLPVFSGCAFEGGEKPAILVDYMRALGMVDEGPRRVRDLDDAMLRGGENVTPGGRSIVKVKKLSALLALCEREPNIRRDTLWIADEHIRLAIRLVQRSNAYAQRVFGYLARSKDENQANAVKLALRRNGALKMGAVMHEAALNRREAQAALDLLVDDGEAETLILDGVRHWRAKE